MWRRAKTYVRWCNVYLEAGTNRAIVATCFNHEGLQAEIPDEARLLDPPDNDLGSEVLAALNACQWEPDFNYRDSKPSDWPAYRASGESTIKSFEQRWRRMRVAGANDANVTWELSIALPGDYDLTMTASVAPTMDSSRLSEAICFLNSQADFFIARRGDA